MIDKFIFKKKGRSPWLLLLLAVEIYFSYLFYNEIVEFVAPLKPYLTFITDLFLK